MFKDKGRKSNDSGYILLEKQDFIRCHFPNGWHRLIDSIGDGVQIDFPVKVRLFLSWSPKTHSLTGESITPCPRYRPEKLSISFCKAACSLIWDKLKKPRLDLILFGIVYLLRNRKSIFFSSSSHILILSQIFHIYNLEVLAVCRLFYNLLSKYKGHKSRPPLH